MDIKKAMDAAKGGIDLILGAIELPNGVVLKDARVETLDDERQLQAIIASAGVSQSPPAIQVSAKPKPSKEELFAHLMEVHLADLRRAGRDSKMVLESRHSLSLGHTPTTPLVSALPTGHCLQCQPRLRPGFGALP